MSDGSSRARGVAGGVFKRNSRKWRWAALAVAGLWLALTVISRSVVASSFMVFLVMVFGGICFVGLRGVGIGSDHPVVRSMAKRPWRDGRDVFRLATEHLSEVFIITPKGSLIAPSAVDIHMNPEDIDSLTAIVDEELVDELALEAYEAAVASSGARVLGGGPADVAVVADPAVAGGRYVLMQRKQPKVRVQGGEARSTAARRARDPNRSTLTMYDLEAPRAVGPEPETIVERAAKPPPSNPLLRLVTGSMVAQTQMSGARAGRGKGVELPLPEEPTISRVHARFSCAGGQWDITGLGRNGVAINGVLLAGTQALHNGDLIRWGRQADSPVSRVEIAQLPADPIALGYSR